MVPKETGLLRLKNQQVSEPKSRKVKELVSWMGAMQAQDYNMAKWALGLRLPGSTEGDIEKALDSGEILRTHLLRPTWHFVSGDDILWMLELTGRRILSSLKSRHKQLELTGKIIAKSNRVIERALRDGEHLTRDELKKALSDAGLSTGENRASHFFLCAELEGIMCSGITKNNKQTYALLRNRISKGTHLLREEALAKLARRYFSSHGPATLKDFAWWSGLTVTEAKQGLEDIKDGLFSETIATQTYWLPDALPVDNIINQGAYLLPAFDEFIVSYTDKTPILAFENMKKDVSDNGIFRPTVIVGGQVTGTWKRTVNKEKVTLELFFFREHTKTEISSLKKAVAGYGNFLGKKTELKLPNKPEK